MPKIFISYRRADSSGYAGRIHERLVHLYGPDSVFMDMEDITPGVNFALTIEDQVAASNALLVLIGPAWLAVDSAGKRRIDDPADFVRTEISSALSRKVRVIPVLLDGARMPTEAELPKDLRGLSRIQAATLTEARWEYDFGKLAGAIKGQRQSGVSRRIAVAGAVLILILGAVVGVRWWGKGATDVTGKWQGTVPYEFGPAQMETFDFQQTGTEIRGDASFLGLPRPITEGRIDDQQILFITRTEEFSGDGRIVVTHRYFGAVDDAEIRLTLQTEGSTTFHPPIAFTVQRIPAQTP